MLTTTAPTTRRTPTTTAMMTTRSINSSPASTASSTIIKTTTTITSDPGILCFHHCNVKVFCFTLPHTCPQCKTALVTYPNSNNNSSNSRRKNKKITKNGNSNSNNDDHHTHENVSNNYHDDDDDDDDDDDGLNENSLACHIMASRLLPFRLPYPFVRANQYPCAIVLRPTTGDFLNDYNNTTDLHIAVTTSTGCVVEFDRHGLRRHRTDNMSEWWQCLLVGDVPEPWYDYWDQVLFEICQQPDKWTVSHYHEDKHNCYTFVLNFLQALTYDKLSEAARSKTRFCEKYIVPRTTTAGKYISLYRKLRDAGIYVHHTNHQKVRAGYAKQGKQQQQQHAHAHQQQHQQHLQQQRNPNKSTNSVVSTTSTTTSTENGSVTTNKHQQQKLQQQHLSNHHNHHSIISRPYSTLCTIEE